MKIKRVTKFKIDGAKGCTAAYLDAKETEITMICKEQPLDSLITAFSKLDKYVVQICELHKDSLVEVTGLSISETKDVIGVVIIAKFILQHSTGVVNLVTPHRTEQFYGEHGDTGQLMPLGLINDLKLAICEIEQYIRGERAGKQDELFLEANIA